MRQAMEIQAMEPIVPAPSLPSTTTARVYAESQEDPVQVTVAG
jgi:hypothetical protein